MTNPDIKNPRAKHDFVGRTCSISAVGSYVPEKVLTNADLEKLVDTTRSEEHTSELQSQAYLVCRHLL